MERGGKSLGSNGVVLESRVGGVGGVGGVEVRGLRQGQYWGLATGRQAGARTCRDRCEKRWISGRGGRSSKRSCGSSGAVVRHSRSVRFPVQQSSCPLSHAAARVGGQIRGGRPGFVWRTPPALAADQASAVPDGQSAQLRSHWAVLNVIRRLTRFAGSSPNSSWSLESAATPPPSW